MRLFVTGDVHADRDYRKIKKFRDTMKPSLTLDDYLVICGDFGVIWDGNEHDKYFKEQVYGDFPCTILWVDGNHENFDVLYTYPIESWMGGKVHRITDRILHLMRGEIFTLPLGKDGTKIFAFGGAKSTDRGYDTGNNQGWWPLELPNQEEVDNALLNLSNNNSTVDYIFTHEGPQSVLRGLFGFERDFDVKFNYLLEKLAHTVDFKGCFFGHHHDDIREDKYHCIYNDIVNLDGKS